MLLDDAIAITLYSLTKYSAIIAETKGYFGMMISNNQLERWNSCPFRICSWRLIDNQLGLNFGAKAFNPVDKAVDVADTTNKLDELAVAKGRAKGHVVAKGRAESHVVAKGRARGQVVAKGRARGRVVAKDRAEDHVAPDNQHG